MANKIQLGKPPKTFTRQVTIPMVDGTEGQIEVVFKYRTRTEFGAFIDSLLAVEVPADEDEKFSMAKFMQQRRDTNAEYLMEVMEGWNLDVPFSLETVQQLADEQPAAANALMDAYRAVIVEGRLGN